MRAQSAPPPCSIGLKDIGPSRFIFFPAFQIKVAVLVETALFRLEGMVKSSAKNKE